MRKLKQKVEKLEKACNQSTKIWRKYDTSYNAYLNADTDDENINYSNLIPSKTKRSKIQKPKKKFKKRPGSSAKSVRSVRSTKSRNNLNKNFQTFDGREPSMENTISHDISLGKIIKKYPSKDAENQKLKQQVKKLKETNKKWKSRYMDLEKEYKRMVNHIDTYLHCQNDNNTEY
mmetsp:Transcript_6008/g.5177  ORF Transcript_6008/g.5177 Transcript_6008/m.5177 type:complete len:175 (+) Transcript_6008:249-773(+)